jgi:nucleotide-binding universal stress UspA family protein
MRILFASDGSPACNQALDSLIPRLAWFRDAPVLDLIHVHPPVPYARAASIAGKEAVAGHYEEDAEAALAPAKARCAQAGVVHNVVKRVGEPSAEIVKQGAEGRYDLIAMGSRGHNALANLLIGSVAQKVIAHSKVPVLLLR